MKNICLSFLALVAWTSLSSLSLAATGKITKVQGNRAIVQFDQPVKAGDVVQTAADLDKGADAELDNSSSSKKDSAVGSGMSAATREYAFEYSWVTASTTQSGSTTTNTAGNLTWWFNYHQFEFAPIGILGFSPSTTTLGIGGIAQYDFIKNNLGALFVPGVYGKVSFTNYSASGSSSSITTLGLGLSLDWFPFVEHVALNGSLEYDTLTNSLNSTPASQFSLISGVKVYF